MGRRPEIPNPRFFVDFSPLEVCLAMFTQKKIYQQLLPSSGHSYFLSLLRCCWLCFVQKICQPLLLSSGSSYFLSLLRCCWLKRSVSKLLLSSAICSLHFISKITTSFTFTFTCFYFYITFALLSSHLYLPFRSFPLWTSSKIVEQYISYGNIWV